MTPPPAAEPDQLAALSKPGFSEAKTPAPWLPSLYQQGSSSLLLESGPTLTAKPLLPYPAPARQERRWHEQQRKPRRLRVNSPKPAPKSPPLAQQDRAPERGQPGNPSRQPHANQQALPWPETETDIYPAARTPGLQTPSSISSRDASEDNGMAGGLRGCSSPTEVGKGHDRGGWGPGAAGSQHLHFGSGVCLRVTGWGGGSPPATPRPLANHPSNGCNITVKLAGTVIITIRSR